jgi:hypothetical protein
VQTGVRLYYDVDDKDYYEGFLTCGGKGWTCGLDAVEEGCPPVPDFVMDKFLGKRKVYGYSCLCGDEAETAVTRMKATEKERQEQEKADRAAKLAAKLEQEKADLAAEAARQEKVAEAAGASEEIKAEMAKCREKGWFFGEQYSIKRGKLGEHTFGTTYYVVREKPVKCQSPCDVIQALRKGRGFGEADGWDEIEHKAEAYCGGAKHPGGTPRVFGDGKYLNGEAFGSDEPLLGNADPWLWNAPARKNCVEKVVPMEETRTVSRPGVFNGAPVPQTLTWEETQCLTPS